MADKPKQIHEQHNKGATLLAALFFQKPKKIAKRMTSKIISDMKVEDKNVHDVVTYYIARRFFENDFPEVHGKNGIEKDVVYGTRVFHDLVCGLIEEYQPNPEVEDYQDVLPYLRKKIVREIVFDLSPEFLDEDKPYITTDSISIFLKTVAENKIWSDNVIRMRTPELYPLITATDPKRKGDQESTIIKDEVKVDKTFEEEEREARAKHVDQRYRKFVEEIDLTRLKILLHNEFDEPFDPKGRQRDILANLKRFVFIAASRRAGKTALASYLASRQFYIPNQVIVIVVPELRTHGKVPRRYLFQMLHKDPNIRFDKSDWTITNKANKSEIVFMSGAREHSVRGSSANLLIFDEAAYLSESVFESASALVNTTNGIVYTITTPNLDTPKNRFYYKLIEAEIARFNPNSQKIGKRITLRENPFIPDIEKERLVEEGKTNTKIFNTEYMAEFTDGEEFDLSRFRHVDYKPVEIVVGGQWYTHIRYEALEKENNIYKKFIIGYDCAKRKDRPGIVVLGIKDGGIDIILADYMNGVDYVDQVKIIIALRKILGDYKTHIVLDYNNVGIVVEELFRRVHKIPVIPVATGGGKEFKRDGNIRRGPKDLCMSKTKSAMSRGVLKGFSFQSNLRLEFETYDDTQNRKHGHHYDILMAMIYAVWVADKYGYAEIDTMTGEEKAQEFWNDGVDGENDYLSYVMQNYNNSGERERENKFGY